MRPLVAGFALLTVIAPLGSYKAEACGDKLLSLARGIRMDRAYRAARAASILIYSGGTTATATVYQPDMVSSLKKAGHQVRTADAKQLDQILRSGKFDLLVTDLRDAAGVAERLAATESKPIILPVLHKPTKAEISAAEKQFTFLLTTPMKGTQHLEAVDLAMKSRPRA